MKLNLVNRMKKTIKNVVATATAPSAPILANTPVKTAAAKTAVKAAPVQKPIVAATTAITIEATIDVGFGNRLFLRGQGGTLVGSWHPAGVCGFEDLALDRAVQGQASIQVADQ